MMSKTINSIKRKAATWMRQGISPQRLALTLALGFAIGCVPLVGIPTLVCAGLALALRLNLPAIQAANYAAMPLQVALIVPFVRLGARLFGFDSGRDIGAGALLHMPTLELFSRMGGMAGEAMLAWLVIAIPAVVLMTATLTLVLRRVPAVAGVRADD